MEYGDGRTYRIPKNIRARFVAATIKLRNDGVSREGAQAIWDRDTVPAENPRLEIWTREVFSQILDEVYGKGGIH